MLGQRGRRVETGTGEQQRVGQEPGQLGEVARATLAQVAERLGGHPGGHGRQRHQFGVRRGLPAQHHRGQATGQHRLQQAGQLRRPPSNRTTIQNAPASNSGTSPGAVRAGLASRHGPPLARAASRSVSDAESSTMAGGMFCPRLPRGDHAPVRRDGRPEPPGSRIAASPQPSRRCAAVASVEGRSPVTVAGPRRIHTGFLRCRPRTGPSGPRPPRQRQSAPRGSARPRPGHYLTEPQIAINLDSCCVLSPLVPGGWASWVS